MSDDEVDEDLIALLKAHLGMNGDGKDKPPETHVLRDAEYVYDNSIDVAIDMQSTKATAQKLQLLMKEQDYSAKTWSSHELHPKEKDEATMRFIFTMDLLNFSFWSENSEAYTVEYKGTKWTGYWSLVASLHRALDENIPITDPHFWINEEECSDDVLRNVFRSDSAAEIPLLEERIDCLREAGRVLYENFNCSFANCIDEASHSAAALVNLLAENFPSFRDETKFDGKRVRFYKRAQILVADLWACFEGTSYGEFNDIDKITMFADYRIPQMLCTFGCLKYSPPLEVCVNGLREISSGHTWEVQLRGCSIWCVELLRREIIRIDPEAHVNAILIDFCLYDMAKEEERTGGLRIPHHRTRSIWY